MTAPPAEPPAEPPAGSEDGRTLRARSLRRARRLEILVAARRVFATHGYHAASIQDILAEAGIARGTFYAHFDGKQAAFKEVLAELLGGIQDAIVPVDVNSSAANYDQLFGNVARALQLLENDPDLGRLLFHQALGVSEEVRDDLAAFYDGVAALILRSLTTGARLGLVRAGDLTLRSRMILAAVREAAAQNLDAESPRPLVEVAREALEFSLRGVLVPSQRTSTRSTSNTSGPAGPPPSGESP